MRTMLWSRVAGPVVPALAAALFLAACAGAGPGLPTVEPGGATAPTSSNAAAPQGTVSSDPAVAWPAFAACLRAHGLDVPDPQLDQQGQPDFGTIDLKSMITPAIGEACLPIVAAVTSVKPSAKSYTFDSLVAHAACLRSHGLPSYPDPDPNAASAQMAPGYDKADPTVNAALVACQGVLVAGSASPLPSR